MRILTLLIVLLGSLAADPRYKLEVIGPGVATSINDTGEIAGFLGSEGFFYSDDLGVIFFGEIYKTLPQITNNSRVFFTARILEGWFQTEIIKPSYWSLKGSITRLKTPNFKVPYWDVSYVNAVSKYGTVVIGNDPDPSRTTEQHVLSGEGWTDVEIKVYAVNETNLYGTEYSTWGCCDTPSKFVFTTDCTPVILKNFHGAWVSINNTHRSVGLKVVNGRIFGMHSAFEGCFSDFYFRKISDNNLAIASSTDDLDSNEYIYNFNNMQCYNIADLVDESSLKILYLFDINAAGDLCGVAKDDENVVAVRLRLVSDVD